MMTFDRVLPEIIRICEADPAFAANAVKACAVRDPQGRVRLVLEPIPELSQPNIDALRTRLDDALTEQLDPETMTFGDAPAQLQINDIAHVGLRTADPLPVDDYADVRVTGCFLLIDPPTGNTLAAGLIGYPLADALS